MTKAVFLDRDGTIIRDIVYLNDPDKIETFTESYEAIKALNANGYLVFLATNQSGVARGIVDENILKKINAMITQDFKNHGAIITESFYCPHAVDAGCLCRKPNPGMLKTAALRHGVDLAHSWMIGDRMTDVVAGRNAGCQTILLQNETTPPVDPTYPKAENICDGLLSASKLIIAKQKQTESEKFLR